MGKRLCCNLCIKIIETFGSSSHEENLRFLLYCDSPGVSFEKDSGSGVINMDKTYEHLDHELQTLDVLVWEDWDWDDEGATWEDEEMVIASESQKEAYFQYVSALEKLSSWQMA